MLADVNTREATMLMRMQCPDCEGSGRARFWERLADRDQTCLRCQGAMTIPCFSGTQGRISDKPSEEEVAVDSDHQFV